MFKEFLITDFNPGKSGLLGLFPTAENLLPHLLPEITNLNPHLILYDHLCIWAAFVSDILNMPSFCSISGNQSIT